ncbi:MAG: hypothetical protein JXJ04_00560, partial [Spirochaetales bacterium]|nr:hypothetical protein [Spirochaetales bacterium]
YNTNIKKINYIGINILKKEYHQIDKWKKNIDFNFYAFHNKIEDLDKADWQKIYKSINGNLLTTAFFSLHHIHDVNNQHSEILSHMRKLGSGYFFIAEPDSNHITENLTERFTHSLLHFKTIFHLITEIKGISLSERIALQWLFQKEIMDIIGNTHTISERHEPVHNWLQKLRGAGFTPCYCFTEIDNNRPHLVDLKYQRSRGYINIMYNNISILSIMSLV